MPENNSARSVVAGIDIGGTKTSAILCNRAGDVIASGTVPTPAALGGTAMSAAAAGLVQRLESACGLRAKAVGVGAAGVIDQKNGVVTAASASFTGWAGFELAADLRSRLGVGAVIDNDVNSFLRGEMSYGALAGVKDAVGLMLGTGVGGAIAVDGQIFPGSRGAAGEIGHTPGYGDIRCTCGQVGHLETLASGRSISERYAEMRGGDERVGADVVAARARSGDTHAQETFARAGRAVALAIATTVNILDVRDVVVGGGVRGAWDLLEPAITDTLAGHMPVSGYSLVVQPGALAGRSAVLGAAAAAWHLVDERATGNEAEPAVFPFQEEAVEPRLAAAATRVQDAQIVEEIPC
ncbi:ROK family protein [Paeniglutamicibacter sp. NPDC012692]|uniref:ROK family protein n=1 Tax=Paeniglutamicibacter sp. NPDC012692 TaxID=3364388 RepID=UPI0036BAC234